MNTAKFSEIKEIDCDRDVDRVNNELAKGWILLEIRKVARKEDGNMIEYPIYILGLPSA